MRRKRILAALGVAGIITGGISFPAYAGSDTKTIQATGGLDQHVPNCGDSTVNAYFVITQVDKPSDAPSQITVSFSNDSTATEPLLTVNGKTAKYEGPVPSGSSVSGASAVIYSSWSGQFNLSHYYCGETTTTTTTTVPQTTTTTVPETTTTVPETTTTTVPTTTTLPVQSTTTTTTIPTVITPGSNSSQLGNVPLASPASPAAASPSSLAATGSDSLPIGLGGAGLITVGAGLVKLSQRKRRHQPMHMARDRRYHPLHKRP